MSMIELPSLNHPDAWEDPILFEDVATPDIPAHLLPGIFGELAAAIAQATETAEALSVMTLLGVVSTVAAKRFMVTPKPGWQEPVNIYTLIALPPANHKSLVLNWCTKPLTEWEQEQALLRGHEYQRLRSERKTQEKIIDALRMKAAKTEDRTEQQQLIRDVAEKEAALIDTPSLPVLFINDVTPESLTTVVAEQNGRLAIFSDEGGVLETLAGLYSNGVANVDIVLKGIDGGEVRVRRKDRSVTLNPYLTMVLAVQPSIVQHLGEKRAFLGNGTLERFLYVLPKSQLGFRTHDKPPVNPTLLHAYTVKIKALLNNQQSIEQACLLTLAPAAYQAWRDFQVTTEAQLRSDGRLANCLGWGGKICGFALRIAGLLHIAEERPETTINAATMSNALEIAQLLTQHAIVAFGLMGDDQTTEDAKIIFQWIKTRNQTSFTQSELLRAMRNKKFSKSESLMKALQLLQSRHLVSAPVKMPTRKPSTLYYIHPAIMEK